ncbi:MAG: hypothetical protein J6Y94_05360, partial [Bacteriovoracaceae bacterium]|nr:hypothetical protein [Bacteriovoracaceae bacterium]
LSEAEQAAEIDPLLASAKDEAALTHFWAREVSLRTYFTDPAYWYEVKRIWQDRDLKAKFFRYHYLFYQPYITAMAQKLKALDDAWVLQETSAGSLPPLKLIELKITPHNIDRLAANSALVERLPIIKDLKSFWDGQSVDANTSLSLVLGELHLPNFIAKQDFNLLGGKVPQAAYLNNKLYLAWNSLADVHFAYPTNLHELMHYKKVNQRIQMLVPNIIGQVRITEGYPKFLDMSELDAYITQLDISKHLASENASGKDHWNFARQEAEGNLIDIANNTEPLLNEVKAQLSAMDLSGDCPFVYTIGANAKNDGISWRKPDLAVLLYHKADAPRDTILVQCPVKDAALIEQNAMRQLGINDAQDPQVKKAVKEELRKQVLAEIDEEIKIMITYMCMYYSGRR